MVNQREQMKCDLLYCTCMQFVCNCVVLLVAIMAAIFAWDTLYIDEIREGVI